MYCRFCNTLNEEDAIFCKKCGHSLIEKYEDNQSKNSNKKSIVKNKTITKVKTKIKKIKVKDKHNNKKSDNTKNDKVIIERKMGFGTKILIFFLILLIIILLGVVGAMGYGLYLNYCIKVPNVINMTYTDATTTLLKNDLNIKKEEKIVTNINEAGIVISQSKDEGTKVLKDTTIKVVVGVIDDTYVMPNLKDKSLTTAKSILESNNIKYKIIYKTITTGKNNIVLKQNYSASKKIKNNDIVILTISKLVEEETNTEETNSENQTNSETQDNTENTNVQ